MKRNNILIYGLVALIVVAPTSVAQAKSLRENKFQHADRNKDETIDKKEWRMEKKWEEDNRQQLKDRWQNMERERIDLNNDGAIDAKEKRLCWRYLTCRVNTPLEDKYDADRDGWLQPQEAREMLKARHSLIVKNGKAKVDSEIEAEYDTDHNGIIDVNEAGELKNDLELK